MGSTLADDAVEQGTSGMSEASCGFRPFPGSGAYGHWTCERALGHRGDHRFRNYTIARTPRLHRGVAIVSRAWWRQTRRVARHVIKYRKWPRVPLTPAYRTHWNRAIWPTTYDPIPNATYDRGTDG